MSDAHSRGSWSRGRTHRERVGVDGDRAQPDLRERAVLVVDLASLERVERVEAVDDLAEDRVCRGAGRAVDASAGERRGPARRRRVGFWGCCVGFRECCNATEKLK